MPITIDNRTKPENSLERMRKRRRLNFGFLEDKQRPIVGIKDKILTSDEMDSHSHIRGQLAYATMGIIKVYTHDGCWVVPPSQAVWIPGDLEHSVTAEVDAEIRHLFVDAFYLDYFPSQCSVLDMTPLLKELILRVADFGTDYSVGSRADRICAVVLDELQALKPSLLYLPGAKDRRLDKIMQAMIQAPDAELGLAYWADYAGASVRTISRLFIKETGLSFQQWRKQLLLQTAVHRLELGKSVTDVALELGYRSTSAFVAMFRKSLGKTPGQYLK